MNRDDVRARLLSKVSKKTSGCWEYTGGKNVWGYGQVSVDGKMMNAHRASYLVFCGSIPGGMIVCHACDNPACINPEHLWVGTHYDNYHDSKNKGRRDHIDTSPWLRREGEEHHKAKLTEEDVLRLRSRYRGRSHGAYTVEPTISSLAEEYDVSYSTIRKAIHGETWAHLTR